MKIVREGNYIVLYGELNDELGYSPEAELARLDCSECFDDGAYSPLDDGHGHYAEHAFSPLPKDGLGIIWYTAHPITLKPRQFDNPDDYEE